MIREWFKRRRRDKEGEELALDIELMKAGYLCPDHSLHDYEELPWEENAQYGVCKKCGKRALMMVKSIESN